MLSIFATSEKQSLFIWQTIRAFPALPYIISVAGTAFLYFCDFNMFSLVLSHDLCSPVCNHLTTPLFLLTPCSLMLYNGMLTACINARLHLELIKKRKLSHVIRKKKVIRKGSHFSFWYVASSETPICCVETVLLPVKLDLTKWFIALHQVEGKILACKFVEDVSFFLMSFICTKLWLSDTAEFTEMPVYFPVSSLLRSLWLFISMNHEA